MSTDIAADPRTRRLLVLTLGAEEYGVPVALVREVIRHTRPRPIPGAAPCIEGVITLRGRIVPVVDLRRRIGVSGDRPEEARIVVLELPDATVGVTVDEATEVLTVPGDRCQSPPPGADADHIAAVAAIEGRLLGILDVPSLVGSPARTAG